MGQRQTQKHFTTIIANVILGSMCPYKQLSNIVYIVSNIMHYTTMLITLLINSIFSMIVKA